MPEESGKSSEFRKIVHLDLDAFFCAVEELHDPSLRNKPFAVGGSPKHRGVVASCSYAARKFGVRSAMPMSQAVRLCPDLINVRHSFGNYVDYSKQVMDILRTYSAQIQPISIDEAFLDLSHRSESAEYQAKQIQREIRRQLSLPSSLGVASNKLIAKIATNVGKASHKGDSYPNAIKIVPAGEEAVFLAPLPSDALWGVGPKTAEKLSELGMHTIGDIAAYSFKELERRFGQTGRYLHRRAQGIDDSPVHSSRETKSVSHEVTYPRDTHDENKLRETIARHARSISKRLGKLELYGSTVKLKLRWSDFTTITRQKTLSEPSDKVSEIEQAALDLLNSYWKAGRKVRLLGVGVSGLGPPSRQLGLWDWDPESEARKERLQTALNGLETRYGAKTVTRASKLKS
jgi:DNA polymerase-4